jgi:cell division control protein 6
MITNARVLQEEFVPKDVEHRHRETNVLASTLEPILAGEQAGNCFLTGPTGVGKTCIARYTVQKLEEQRLQIHSQYVNCWQDHTRFQTLFRLLDEVQRTHDIHRQSTPQDELVRRLREGIDHPYVAILDEVDQLEDEALLYELDQIPGLTLLFISNREEDVFGGIDDRIRSRFKGARRIHFDRYTVAELTAILRSRVDTGFEPESITRAQLERISDAAAGDARVGIRILRTAARDAQAQGQGTITDDVISEAVPEARETIRQKTIEGLNPHQRTLYRIIVDEGEVSPNTLYEAYRSRIDADPKTERTLRNYLSKLHQYNLIRKAGNTRGRTYSSLDTDESASPSSA